MLLEFTVGNYYSIKDETTLNMVSTKNSNSTNDDHLLENIIKSDEGNILKSTVLFGANGSGKSNFIAGMNFFKHFVKNSFKDYTIGDKINIKPFLFYEENIKAPSLFEIVFIQDRLRYRYGFEVNKNRVESEWLYVKYSSRESQLFYRDNSGPIELGTKLKNVKKYLNSNGTVRENALFLSTLVQNGVEDDVKVVAEFVNNIIMIGETDENFAKTVELLDDETNNKYRNEIIEIMKSVDFGLDDLKISKTNVDFKEELKDLPEELKGYFFNKLEIDAEELSDFIKMEIGSKHKVYKNENEFSRFEYLDFNEESLGTRKFFALIGVILDSIYNGKIIFVDELESSLHVFLVEFIVKMFNSSKNCFGGQLIFSTHNTSLLNSSLFRRDQIWFVEKNNIGASNLKSLSDFKIRKDLVFETNYKLGKFGAIPFIKELQIIGELDEC
ncbi:ATP/GTP-binding protein [Fusibacter sp. 3D3]|uniref:AAA family ATPase n=1 Tax=Fusibacter sp. 3D3 TaxID=1048380 RepID=UPI000853180E|nr:ATP-binding protein [Fusibacter sp. 3D3]GAU78417.1 putative abortive infection protein [Fusibacter sp. 3D3]